MISNIKKNIINLSQYFDVEYDFEKITNINEQQSFIENFDINNL